MYVWALLGVMSVIVAPSTAQLEADIDELVDAVLNCTDIPGLALTVVRDGQVTAQTSRGLHGRLSAVVLCTYTVVMLSGNFS